MRRQKCYSIIQALIWAYLGVISLVFTGGWKVMNLKQCAWDVEIKTAARNSSGGRESLHTMDFLKAVRSRAFQRRAISLGKLVAAGQQSTTH